MAAVLVCPQFSLPLSLPLYFCYFVICKIVFFSSRRFRRIGGERHGAMPPLILALSLKGLPDNFMLCQSFCSTVPPCAPPLLSATPSRPLLSTHTVVVMYKFSVVVRKMCSRFIHLLFCSIPWVSCGCLSVYSRVYNTQTHTQARVCGQSFFAASATLCSEFNSEFGIQQQKQKQIRSAPTDPTDPKLHT